MASLLGCFKPRRQSRPSRPSVAGITSAIARHHSAMAWITIHGFNQRGEEGGEGEEMTGVGILIYPSLLLTTSSTFPSRASIENADISLRYSETSLNILKRKLLPHLFFSEDSRQNLALVACEFVSPEMRPLGLDPTKVDSKAFDGGNKVYILGYEKNRQEAMTFSVGSGYIVDEIDGNFLEIRTRDEEWMGGSAGFDHLGNFSFMVTKCVSHQSGLTKSSAVTIKKIRDWLEAGWESTKGEDGRAAAGNSRTRPSPQGLIFRRRATWGGPEERNTVESYVEDFDKKLHVADYDDSHKGNDDEGKEKTKDVPDDKGSDHGVDKVADKVPIRQYNEEKNTNVRVVDVGSGNIAIKKDPRRSISFKERTDKGKAATFELRTETSTANGTSNAAGKPAPASGFEAKVTVTALQGEKGDGKKTKIKKKKAVITQNRELAGDRRTKPTLRKAFERDRRSLQIRLTDLSKVD